MSSTAGGFQRAMDGLMDSLPADSGPCIRCGAIVETRTMRDTDWLCESHEECLRCEGTGELECDACHGCGDHQVRAATWDDPEERDDCGQCEGSGNVACPDCQDESRHGEHAASADHRAEQIWESRSEAAG